MVAKRVVSLEEIEADRERKLGTPDRRIEQMMRHEVERRLGRRPVGGVWNGKILAQSPGSRIPCVDYVKAVYAERTGQESM